MVTPFRIYLRLLLFKDRKLNIYSSKYNMFEMVLSVRICLNKERSGDLYKKTEANHLVSLS